MATGSDQAMESPNVYHRHSDIDLSSNRHNSKDTMDSASQEFEAIIECGPQSEGDSKEKRKELEDKVSSLKQQVQELQSSNEQLKYKTDEHQSQS